MSRQVHCACGIMIEWDLDVFSIEEGIGELLCEGWTIGNAGTLICPDCSHPNRIPIEIRESNKDTAFSIPNSVDGMP